MANIKEIYRIFEDAIVGPERPKTNDKSFERPANKLNDQGRPQSSKKQRKEGINDKWKKPEERSTR